MNFHLNNREKSETKQIYIYMHKYLFSITILGNAASHFLEMIIMLIN